MELPTTPKAAKAIKVNASKLGKIGGKKVKAKKPPKLNPHVTLGDQYVQASVRKRKEYNKITQQSQQLQISQSQQLSPSQLSQSFSESQRSQLSQLSQSQSWSFELTQGTQSADGTQSQEPNSGDQKSLLLYVWDQFHTELFRIKCFLIKGTVLNGVAKNPDTGIQYTFNWDGVRNKLIVTGTDHAIDWQPTRKPKKKSLLHPTVKRKPPEKTVIDPSLSDEVKDTPLEVKKEETKESKGTLKRQVRKRTLFV